MRPTRPSALRLAVLALGACGGPPVPVVAAPPPRATAHVTAPAIAPDEACRAARALRDQERRAAHGVLQVSGRWVTEEAGAGDARVWELTAGGPRLRLRTEVGEIRLLRGDQLAVTSGDDLAFFDLATGAPRGAARGQLLGEGDGVVLVGEPTQARRLRLPDLAPAGAVPWNDPVKRMRDPDDARVLRGGTALIAGDTLVSFETGTVLLTGADFGATRADERRLLACDSASQAMLDVDVTSGAIGARFAVGAGVCPREGMGRSNAAYAADPRFAFWFEHGPERKDAGDALVVAVGNTRTGAVTRFVDPGATWSIGFSSQAHLDDDGAHLCARLSGFHFNWEVCGWKLRAGGGVARSPAPTRGGTLASLGLPGARELSRVWSPSRDRLAVATYRRDGDTKRDLRLTIAGKGGTVERSVVLEAGEVQFDDSTLEQDVSYPEGVVPPPPRLVFFDERHVALLAGAFGLPRSRLVDVATGAVTPLCGESAECSRAGRFVAVGEGRLRDPVAGSEVVLSATDAEWAAALRMPALCP